MRPIVWISKKTGLQKKAVPTWLKSEKPRWIAFSIFLVGLAYTIYTITQGRKFPLPLIIIPLGLATVFLVNERAWHRYLCPWGVLFSLTARFSKRGIKTTGCTSCLICQKNCPGEAITVEKGKPAVIDPTHCLVCFDCKNACPSDAMTYR